MRSLIALLEATAGSDPDRLLYTFRNASGSITRQCTFGEFHKATDGLAQRLSDTGAVRPSEPVLLAYQPGLDFAEAFYACAKIGSIPVPVPPPGRAKVGGDTQRIEHIARDCGARTVLHEKRLTERLSGLDALDASTGPLSLIDTTELDVGTDGFDAAPGEVLFLQYTSGSTENPRGVIVTHENVIHNASFVVETPPDTIPVGVSWLPHYHDMGLVGFYLFAVTTGGNAHILSPLDFLKRPLAWLQTISEVSASITSAPNFALKYCLRDDKVNREDLAGIDLSSLDCLLNGAEPVQFETVDRFIRKFEASGLRRSAVMAGYGLAEHTLCVTKGLPEPVEIDTRAVERGRPAVAAPAQSQRYRHAVVSCGRPATGITVKIVDPEKRAEVPEGCIGEIWVSSPSKARGYWNRPELTRETFKARLSRGDDGEEYLRTGDMGFLHDGALFVCGRRKDMIVIRGQNIYPTDVEALVEQEFKEIAPGSVAAFGIGGSNCGEEKLIVILESGREQGSALLHAIQREIRKDAGVSADTLAIVPKGTIAHTSSGKIVRHDCRERWISGKIEVSASISAGDFDGVGPDRYERVVEEILERFTDLEDLSIPLEAAGLDSLDLVTLSLYLEDRISQLPTGRRRKEYSFSELAVLQAMTVGELIDLHRTFKTSEPDWGVLSDTLAGIGKSIAEEDVSAMRKDSVLPHWNAAADHAPAEAGGTVLITGATGFLGSYLLRSLLQLTEFQVIALVRCDDEDSGRDRLVRALAATGMNAVQAERLAKARVSVLPGDLSQSHLGLASSQWDRLAQRVGNIYHCAAEVDYIRSYRSLRSANVSGTRSLLELASNTGAAFHFISTTFIFGWTILDRLRETARNSTMKGVDFGYAQSKWASEQLVHEAIRRGQRAKIYRPSLVTASRDAHFVARDVTARVLGYMIRHGISVDLENQISFVPVDICANNIVAISLLDNVKLDTFHVTESAHYSLATVCAAITEQYGYAFETVSPRGFLDHVKAHCHEDDDLFPLRGFVGRNLPKLQRMKRKRYDNTNYQRACSLSANAIKHPPLAQTVGAIVDFLREERLV